MIVQHRQGMARRAAHGEVALEIHLPQRIGRLVLETLPGHVLVRLSRVDASMAQQDRLHRARRRQLSPAQMLEPPAQLTRAPCRVRIAQLQDRPLYRILGAPRTRVRPTRLITKNCAAYRSLEPFVPRLAADAKAPAQRGPIGPFSRGQHYELPTQ